MGDFEKMKKEAVAQTLIEYYKSRGLYNAILKILEGFWLEELTLQEQIPYPSAQQEPGIFLVEEVERSLEEKRKLILQNNGVDSIEFQEIDCNDLKFLNENEVLSQIYSNIKEEIVHEAFRVLHLLSDGESYRQIGDKDDLSTSVTDEFIKLLEDTYRDNPEFHFIPSMAFNQILQSYGEHLNSRERVVNPGWKKIFVAVYHAKHFYGCIAHVREKKLYIVDSCDGVTINSYQSTVLILLTYMSRELDVTQENWNIHIVKNCPQQDDVKNSGVFMCKYFQYWARGERLPFDGKNIVTARLVLLYEVKNRVLTDQMTWEEDLKQIIARGRLDFLDKKMEKSSSSKVAFEGSTKIKLKLTQAPEPQKDHEKQSDQSTQAMQPLKVRENESKQCTQVDFRQKKPEWLERFFKRTFFDSCSEHPIRRNELNKYCIDCDASLCQYCLSLASHANHRLLKIYRHVYKDVVPLDEIERHIDCSQIQPYRCNRQMVIALTPLPHSGGKTNDEATCQTCNRKLIEYDVYSYCSISCKVEAFSKKENDSSPPFLSLGQSVQEAEEPKPKKITRKRKGVPHRAPLS